MSSAGIMLALGSFALVVGLGVIVVNLIWLRQMHRERNKKPNLVETQSFSRAEEVFEEMTATGITPSGVSWFNEIPSGRSQRSKGLRDKQVGRWRK